MGRDLPSPPGTAPKNLPSLQEQSLSESWRIHRGEDPLPVRSHKSGRFRFDAPSGEFPVTYVNSDKHACYAEVFGDAGEIPPNAGNRRLSRVWATRPLRLMALDLADVQKAFGLDLRISATLDYPLTQSWSRAWHRWYPTADGIRYLGRHSAKIPNVCLYLDRCADALEATVEGTLKDLRRTGLEAAHRYSLAPRLFLPLA